MKHMAVTLLFGIFATSAYASEDGLITKPSKYSVEETAARFEAAVKEREAAGFVVFTQIDHAAAAKKFGIETVLWVVLADMVKLIC